MAGEMIEFASSGGGTTPGYLAMPEAEQAPSVIVLQEWWGLVPHIKGVADRFAEAGFVALAPDLYHGAQTKSPDAAGKLMMTLDIERAERDLRGAVKYLRGHERVAGGAVGTVGFCMGGVLSLFAAASNPQVRACVIFYGIHPKVNPPLENLQAPVLGLYAERDSHVPPAAVHDLEEKLKALGKSAEMHIYKGVDHAFFNDERPEVYDAAAAEDAWRRTVDFFRKHLV